MKCPSCSHQHKHKEGMRCSVCSYAFVYDPKSPPMLGDAAVLALVKKASANDTQAFTATQIKTALMLRKGKSNGIVPAVFFLFLGGVFSAIGQSAVPIIGGSVLAVAALIFGYFSKVEWSTNDASALVAKLPQLLHQHTRPAAAPLIGPDRLLLNGPATEGPDDLFDYGVERVLLVDEKRTVDLLVKNAVHADQRCAILSFSGYPDFVKTPTIEAIRSRPDLPVFLLHGTNVTSPSVPSWLPVEDHPVIDIGLTVDNFRALKAFRHLPTDAVDLPVDALPNGALTSVLERCFATQSSMEMLVSHGDDEIGGVDFGMMNVVGDFG